MLAILRWISLSHLWFPWHLPDSAEHFNQKYFISTRLSKPTKRHRASKTNIAASMSNQSRRSMSDAAASDPKTPGREFSSDYDNGDLARAASSAAENVVDSAQREEAANALLKMRFGPWSDDDVKFAYDMRTCGWQSGSSDAAATPSTDPGIEYSVEKQMAIQSTDDRASGNSIASYTRPQRFDRSGNVSPDSAAMRGQSSSGEHAQPRQTLEEDMKEIVERAKLDAQEILKSRRLERKGE